MIPPLQKTENPRCSMFSEQENFTPGWGKPLVLIGAVPSREEGSLVSFLERWIKTRDQQAMSKGG